MVVLWMLPTFRNRLTAGQQTLNLLIVGSNPCFGTSNSFHVKSLHLKRGGCEISLMAEHHPYTMVAGVRFPHFTQCLYHTMAV